MEVKINIVEAASNLADERVKENFRRALIVATNYNPTPEQIEELIYQEAENGDIVYKPEAQEIFNNFYDMFYDSLLKCESKSEEGTLFKNEFEITNETLENTKVDAGLIVQQHSKNMIQGLYSLINKNYSIKNTDRNSRKFSVRFIVKFLKDD